MSENCELAASRVYFRRMDLYAKTLIHVGKLSDLRAQVDYILKNIPDRGEAEYFFECLADNHNMSFSNLLVKFDLAEFWFPGVDVSGWE